MLGGLQNSSSVCNGQGSCNAVDTCVCNTNWGGANCSIPKCFGTLQNSTLVCSGHGTCTAPDHCSCSSGFFGNQCENSVNSPIIVNASCWDSSEMGAPKPQIFFGEWRWNSIFIEFFCGSKCGFTHGMRIGENSSFHADSCTLSGGEGVNLTLVTSDYSCFNVYTSPVFSLDYLMTSPNVKKETIGDLVKLTVPIALYYLDVIGSNNGGFFRAYEFTSSQAIYLTLTSSDLFIQRNLSIRSVHSEFVSARIFNRALDRTTQSSNNSSSVKCHTHFLRLLQHHKSKLHLPSEYNFLLVSKWSLCILSNSNAFQCKS